MTRQFTKKVDLTGSKRQAESVYREHIDMTVELDARKLTEPVRLVVIGDRGAFTTIIDPDPSKPFGKAINEATVAEPKKARLYQIYPHQSAQIRTTAQGFHNIVEKLTTLGVTGFVTMYHDDTKSYSITLGAFTTTISPTELYAELKRIHAPFSNFTFLSQEDND